MGKANPKKLSCYLGQELKIPKKLSRCLGTGKACIPIRKYLGTGTPAYARIGDDFFQECFKRSDASTVRPRRLKL